MVASETKKREQGSRVLDALLPRDRIPDDDVNVNQGPLVSRAIVELAPAISPIHRAMGKIWINGFLKEEASGWSYRKPLVWVSL